MSHGVELFVSVDHHAFTLQDERSCWNGVWTNRSFQQDGVGVAPGVVSMADATRRRGEAPVLVELLAAPPGDEDMADYDGVVDAPLEAPSGKLRIVNATGMFLVGSVAPGSYRVRVFYGNADAAEQDGDSGADHFRISVWPALGSGPSRVDVRVLKPRFDVWETKYHGPRTRADLAAWLGDQRSVTAAVSHRCLATVGLLRMGDLETVRLAMIRETSRAVQAVYASALWVAKDDALEMLAGLVLSPSREIRRRAVQSLTRLRSAAASCLIANLTDDPDAAVRAAVTSAQAERGSAASGAL